MYKYQYLPIEQAKVGDLVELKYSFSNAKQGSLHLVTRVTSSAIYVNSINNAPFSFGSGATLLNLIKTKPIMNAVRDDIVICYNPMFKSMEEFRMKPFKLIKVTMNSIFVRSIGECSHGQFIACCNENDIKKKLRIPKQQKLRNK